MYFFCGLVVWFLCCWLIAWYNVWWTCIFFCVCAWLMDGWMDGCYINKGGRGCGGGCNVSPTMRTKYRQNLGKYRVVWFGYLVWWLLGRLPMQNKNRQHLGKIVGCLVYLLLVGYPSFLVYYPSFGWCIGWFGLLGLLFFGFGLLGGFVGLAALLLGWLALHWWIYGWMGIM